MSSPPSGWYQDPEDASLERYWDGDAWTEDRRPVATSASAPTSSAAPFGSSGGRLSRGLGAAKRMADSAKQSATVQRASEAAASVGHAVADVAKDPAKRAAAVTAAPSTVKAALDAAKVVGKDGKVKKRKVLLAVARPRKTVTRVSAGVASAGAAQVLDAARSSQARHSAVSPTDEGIAAEWGAGDLETDLDEWRTAVERFDGVDVDDAAAMRDSALRMCSGLKHCLIGSPPIDDDDQIVETVGDVLVAALRATSSSGLDAELASTLRLALAVARRFGVQPEELGGNGELDLLFEDVDNRMRYAMALAPSKWSCDMSVWFGSGGGSQHG